MKIEIQVSLRPGPDGLAGYFDLFVTASENKDSITVGRYFEADHGDPFEFADFFDKMVGEHIRKAKTTLINYQAINKRIAVIEKDFNSGGG